MRPPIVSINFHRPVPAIAKTSGRPGHVQKHPVHNYVRGGELLLEQCPCYLPQHGAGPKPERRGERKIYVSRKADVATLDTFIGPKR